jgi:hypothetical protein
MAGLDVVELLRVENVLAVMGKECRDSRYNAGAIGAGQGQHELMIGHETGLFAIESAGRGPCSITRDALAPILAEASK